MPKKKKDKFDEPFEPLARLRIELEKKHGKKKGGELMDEWITKMVAKAFASMPWDIEKE